MRIYLEHFLKKKEIAWHPRVLRTKKGCFPVLIRALFFVCSLLFQAVVKVRRWLYRTGILRSIHPRIPVISIGNIIVGGVGKTPFCILLTQALCPYFHIAILIRGYRSHSEHSSYPIEVCYSNPSSLDPLVAGDEAVMLAKNMPEVSVFVSKHKSLSALQAVSKNFDCLIIDDGLQHLQLCRDYDIVILDAKDPLGGGYYLPYGILREDPALLQKASLIVLNHGENNQYTEQSLSILRKITQSPVIVTALQIVGVFDRAGNNHFLPKGAKVAAYCGIGQPSSFVDTLHSINLDVVDTYVLADHDYPSLSHLEQFAQHAHLKGAEYLLCTEKDMIKWHENITLALPLCWVKVRLQIIDGQQEWHRFIHHLVQYASKSVKK